MEKKKREKVITRRFNADDVDRWQEQANLQSGGNLTLWIENTLNASLQAKVV